MVQIATCIMPRCYCSAIYCTHKILHCSKSIINFKDEFLYTLNKTQSFYINDLRCEIYGLITEPSLLSIIFFIRVSWLVWVRKTAM